MPVKKEKWEHGGMHKIFLGVVLVIVGIIFSMTPDFQDAWMYTFFVVGILFILKGIYISSIK